MRQAAGSLAPGASLATGATAAGGTTNVTVAVVQAQLNEPSGFDEYDLEAALTAHYAGCEFVRVLPTAALEAEGEVGITAAGGEAPAAAVAGAVEPPEQHRRDRAHHQCQSQQCKFLRHPGQASDVDLPRGP